MTASAVGRDAARGVQAGVPARSRSDSVEARVKRAIIAHRAWQFDPKRPAGPGDRPPLPWETGVLRRARSPLPLLLVTIGAVLKLASNLVRTCRPCQRGDEVA